MFNSHYRIAHVMPSPYVGGTEYATLRIAQAVANHRFESAVFCPGASSQVKDMFAANGFDAVGFQAVEPSYRHPQAFLRASMQLAREFRRRNIDLIHCADLLAGYYAGVAGKIARLPVLCHVRCNHGKLSRRDRSFLLAIDRFVFVSRDACRHFGQRVPAHRETVVYDGIDVSEHDEGEAAGRSVRHEFGIPEDVQIVGTVARVTPAKDYDTLAQAAARVVADDPRVRFLIVGDHSQSALNRRRYEEVTRTLASHDLTPYFIFTDHRDDVARLISAMDIFVLSTHTEGLPLVILEAMAQAKPVLATAVGGVPEIVVHEQTGLLHQHRQPADLAAHILSLLHDQERAVDLGESGRRFVIANFSKERFALNMANLYRDMLAGRAPRLAQNYDFHSSLK